MSGWVGVVLAFLNLLASKWFDARTAVADEIERRNTEVTDADARAAKVPPKSVDMAAHDLDEGTF